MRVSTDLLTSRRRRVGSLVVAPALAMLLLTVAPGAALGAAAITFNVGDGNDYGGACIAGTAPAGHTLKIVWRSAAGALKAKTIDQAVSAYGNWAWCPQPAASFAVGDRFKATDGSITRKFTMPEVTFVVDRVANNLHGRAPANTSVHLEIFWGALADHGDRQDATADSAGDWVYTDGEDVSGDAYVFVTWTSAKGDTVQLDGSAPQIRVTIGEAALVGNVPEGLSTKIKLRDGAEAPKGKATTKNGGYFNSSFRNSAGYRVPVAAGDHILGTDIAADMDWYVPDSYATANVDKDVVRGYCEDRGLLSLSAVIAIYRSGDMRGIKWIRVDESGLFRASFRGQAYPGFSPANIKPGDQIEVRCRLTTGDYVSQFFDVP